MKISDPILVYAPEMKGNVSKWGAYAIPRMWRDKNGELVIRFNGEADSMDVNSMFCLPNLYFVSKDNGDTWELEPNGDNIYDISVLTGIDSPYLDLENGEKLFLKYKKNCAPIENLNFKKEIEHPCGEAIMRSYYYGDIPDECKGIAIGKIDKDGKTSFNEINFDFPEREILVNCKAKTEEGSYVDVPQYIQPNIFKLPYLSCLNKLPDGTLVALCTGQNPEITDRYSSELYLVVSIDEGKTFTKRAVVAGGKNDLPYGYGGDGGEVSLTVDSEGNFFAVMRMDMSIHPDFDEDKVWGTYFTASFDGGYTWDKPREIADSSVTPHIKALKDDILLVIYGRPGVHCKVSYDKGKTWSESYSIIGKTLTEERNMGRNDAESKYFDSCSYSNTFVEKIADDTVIVCFNNLKYPDKNGVPTKAAFVRKITV